MFSGFLFFCWHISLRNAVESAVRFLLANSTIAGNTNVKISTVAGDNLAAASAINNGAPTPIGVTFTGESCFSKCYKGVSHKAAAKCVIILKYCLYPSDSLDCTCTANIVKWSNFQNITGQSGGPCRYAKALFLLVRKRSKGR